MCSEVAHYNNNALGVARANLSLISAENRFSDNECGAILGDAMEALDRLELLSTELEIFAGVGSFRAEVMDLGSFLGIKADTLRAACGKRELHLEIATSPMLIHSDPRLLMAAIRALLPCDPVGLNNTRLNPVILRCVPAPLENGGPIPEAGGIELSVGCRDFLDDTETSDSSMRLFSRRRGFLELGVWFARELSSATGGHFYHAYDDIGRFVRMIFMFPDASGRVTL